MKRVSKRPDERKAQLIEMARRLFLREGYVEVSVSRIVHEVGVAQGTFYYYFSSKEEILDAVIEEYLSDLSAEFAKIEGDRSLDARAAFECMVRTEMSFDAERARELCGIQGADMHTRFFSRTLRTLAPHYLAVIERGVELGAFRTPCPDLVAETVILHVHFLFDRDVMGWDDKEYARRLTAAASLLGVLLDLREGGFDFMPTPGRGQVREFDDG